MDKPTHVLLVAALTVAILAGGVYITRSASIDCWNFWGLTKGCSVSTK